MREPDSLTPFLAALLLIAGSCSNRNEAQQIERTRIVDRPWDTPLEKVPAATRLGFKSSQPAATDVKPAFDYELPSGWQALEARRFREINLHVAGDAAAECYVTVMARGGGGLGRNIARWCTQMGREPLDDAAIQKLPKVPLAELGGAEAVLLEIDGHYSGMGTEARPDQRLMAAVIDYKGWGVFVKMVGPKALIERERSAFVGFLKSLTARPAQAPAKQAGGGLTWDAPSGWRQGPERQMRLVTFFVGEGETTTCYVAAAGGTPEQNADRWRSQLGAAALAKGAFDALETIEVLGRKAHIVEVAGDFNGAMGAKPIKKAMLLGAIVPLPQTNLFVKMLGPEAVVRSQRPAFAAFCRSLRMAR